MADLSWLAGLGGGATAAGNAITAQNALAQERQRQAAIDALGKLKLLNDIGGQVVAPGTNPQDAITQSYLTQPGAAQMLRAQSPQDVLAAAPGVGADLSDIYTTQLPNATGGADTVVVNPARSAAELASDRAMKRVMAQQQAIADRTEALENLKLQGTHASAADITAAYNGDPQALGRVLSTSPDLATALTKPAPPPKNIDPNSSDVLKQRYDLQLRNMLAAARARQNAGGNADQQRMQFVNQMAQDPISTLEDWYGNNRNPNTAASLGSHVPLVGNAIAGTVDPQFANAQLAAKNLANAYIQAQPKGRGMTAQTAAMVEQLIAPQIGDTPERRAQKLKTIQVFKAALDKRAGQANAGSNFSDLIPGGTGAPDDEEPPDGGSE